MRLIEADCMPLARPCPLIGEEVPQTKGYEAACDHNVLRLVVEDSGNVVRAV
jgi:hypothetical protein